MKADSLLLVALVTVFASVGCGTEDSQKSADWAQWRGATGLGISDLENLPEEWNIDGTNIRWSIEVPGEGNSSPIVRGGSVFLTSARENPKKPQQKIREILAFDLTDGSLQWRTPLHSTPKEKIHYLSSYAAATPAATESHIFVYFGSFLAKLTLEGELVWRQEVDPTYHRTARYGAASSPVLVDDMVVLFQDIESTKNNDTGWLAAFDQETGEERWRHEWTETCCAYSTPLVYDDGEIVQLLVAFSGHIESFVAATGESLWSQTYEIHQLVPSIALEGDLLCVTGGGHRINGTACMRLVGQGRETKIELLWQTPRLAASTSSPLLYRGRLYVLTQKGILVQYEPVSGKIHWQQRLPRGHCSSSLIAGDGKVYATSSRGPTSVVAAEDEYRLIADNLLERGLSASAAVSEECLLFRSKKQLFCIGSTPESKADAA
ncbi:MAG: PQQ-binding-like beta-propeller repeat protein [Deltaproteobacteria bacterium]|nr:PQQ-binding-like beta-propeller repeat protein [Deltaproteobacteria bacterium]